MVHNAVLNTLGLVLYFFTQWLTTVLAVRLGSFDTAGVYAVVISFCNIFYYVALFGIRNYQISDVEGRFSEGQYSGARIICAATAFLSCAVASLWRSDAAYVVGCYVLYMVFKLGEAYTEAYFSVLQIQRRYGRIFFSYALKALLPVTAFTAVIYRTKGILEAIAAMTVAYFLVILLDLRDQRSFAAPRPQWKGCLGILGKCVPLFLISLTVPVMNYITRHAVEDVLGYYSLGQYASLSSVIVVMSTMAGAVFLVLIPEVSEWWKTRGRQRILRLFLRISLLMVLTGLLAVLVGRLWGAPVCSLIFGTGILESIDLLIPLLVTASVLMAKSFFSCMLVPLDRRGLLLIGETAGMVLCVATAFPFVRRWGLHGANASYLAGVLLQLLLLSVFCVLTVKKKEKEIFSDADNKEGVE